MLNKNQAHRCAVAGLIQAEIQEEFLPCVFRQENVKQKEERSDIARAWYRIAKAVRKKFWRICAPC